MEFRHLGRSGLQVSAIGLGTNNFGGRMDEQSSIAVVQEALDQGINMIDTANMYGNTLSETFIGKAVKGRRDQALLATKVSGAVGEGPNQRGNSRHHILREVEKSLQRLQTDYIDLYQIHFQDPGTPIEETLRALDDLVHQGKVRYIGCSNFMAWQVAEAQWTSRTLGLNGFISTQPQYNLLSRGIERELLPFCQAYNVGIIPYSPLAGGFLTGKYRPGEPAPQGTRLAGRFGARTLTEENYDLLTKLETFATEHSHTVLELAMGWLLAKPQVATVIAGATQREQVRANVQSGLAWRLSPEEVKQADEITQVALRR